VTDLLASGVDWLRRTLRAHAAQSVTYIRSAERVSIPAVFGMSETEDLGDGVIVQTRSRDFLIDRADLVIAGQRTEPQEGDRIEWFNRRDSMTYKFDVMAVGDESFAVGDAYVTGWRIHTRLVGEA